LVNAPAFPFVSFVFTYSYLGRISPFAFTLFKNVNPCGAATDVSTTGSTGAISPPAQRH